MSQWPTAFNSCLIDYQKMGNAGKAEIVSNHINVCDADIGRKAPFARVAIHHVTLTPNHRTSFPHAESHEEEFVYVLAGHPHVWLNGHVYPLKPGHAIGFPAGTGIAHSIINNTSSDVQLIVAGDSTKNKNRCAFPINSEQKSISDIWWTDYPKHALGNHDGLPGPIEPTQERHDYPPYCIYSPEIREFKSFSYPGDTETFGQGFRISDKIGLKSLGIWLERLPPGYRSSYPHAHTHEEEFAFILAGNPTLWLNGFTHRLQPDDAVAFVPNTGLAHCLINDSNTVVEYLCIGETQEFPDEKIIYPMNPLRNEECREKGWLWENPPNQPFGEASPLPSKIRS